MHGMERANRVNRRPAWGWLYASAALALAPFVLVATIVPEGAVRTLMKVVAGLILIGALASWQLKLVARGIGGAQWTTWCTWDSRWVSSPCRGRSSGCVIDSRRLSCHSCT